MPKEIERKYLLTDNSWKNSVVGKAALRQGYIAKSNGCLVRIRISDKEAWITVKGKQVSFTRPEFEYQIPISDAEELLKEFSSENQIIKTRFFLEYQENKWIVDVFEGQNYGLIIAEIELESEMSDFALPPWIGEDVTTDFRYTNSNLVEYPYNKWA
ncbi:CYTH domain-containing protein [bacterium]|nr:CYTH domain-containing protein [bacterium]